MEKRLLFFVCVTSILFFTQCNEISIAEMMFRVDKIFLIDHDKNTTSFIDQLNKCSKVFKENPSDEECSKYSSIFKYEIYDFELAESFLRIMNGDITYANDLKNNLSPDLYSQNVNAKALEYFVYHMTGLVDQFNISSEFQKLTKEQIINMSNDINDFDLNKSRKLNYLLNMLFWEEESCYFKKSEPKFEIFFNEFQNVLLNYNNLQQNDKIADIISNSMIFGKKCNCDKKTIELYSNIAVSAGMYFYSKYGKETDIIHINDKTSKNLKPSKIYGSNISTYEMIKAKSESNKRSDDLNADIFSRIKSEVSYQYNTIKDFILPATFKSKYKDNFSIKLIKDSASNENGYSFKYILGEKYLAGDEENGVIQDHDLSMYFFEQAANKGFWLAKYNLSVMLRSEDPQRSRLLLEQLIQSGDYLSYIGLGTLYYRGIGVQQNSTEALKYFQLALESGYDDAYPFIVSIYLDEGKHNNRTKAQEYIEYGLEKKNNRRAVLNNLRYLSANNSESQCYFIKNSVKDLLITSDFNMWYRIAYHRYLMGEFDSALIIFSFCALGGHLEAIHAAEYMWSNNITGKLTCRFGNNLLCASYYRMQLSMYGEYNKIVSTAQTVEYITKHDPKPETKKIYSRIFADLVYIAMSKYDVEAQFRLAMSKYDNEDKFMNDHSQADYIMDDLISKCFTVVDNIKSLLPAVLTRFYYFIHRKV